MSTADNIYEWWRLGNVVLGFALGMFMAIKTGRIWDSSTIDVKLACVGMALYGFTAAGISLSRALLGYPTDWGVIAGSAPTILMLVSALVPPRRGRTYG